MAVAVDTQAGALEAPPFAYKATLDLQGDRVEVRPDRSRAGGLGAVNLSWYAAVASGGAIEVEALMGTDEAADWHALPAADATANEAHHFAQPFLGLRWAYKTKPSGKDLVVKVVSEWLVVMKEG